MSKKQEWEYLNSGLFKNSFLPILLLWNAFHFLLPRHIQSLGENIVGFDPIFVMRWCCQFAKSKCVPPWVGQGSSICPCAWVQALLQGHRCTHACAHPKSSLQKRTTLALPQLCTQDFNLCRWLSDNKERPMSFIDIRYFISAKEETHHARQSPLGEVVGFGLKVERSVGKPLATLCWGICGEGRKGPCEHFRIILLSNSSRLWGLGAVPSYQVGESGLIFE